MVDVLLNGSLSFYSGANTPSKVNYKLYFGTDVNYLTQYNLGNELLYNYNNLQPNTNYYWKIETVSNTGNILATSDVWNFTTKKTIKIFEGSIVLASQSEVDAFDDVTIDYTEITGNVIIGTTSPHSTNITNLSALKNLNKIGGNLTIHDNNKSLRSIESLSNITSVGGSLSFSPASNQINSLNGFRNLTSIGGSLKPFSIAEVIGVIFAKLATA
mgnify:FL=1